MTEPARLSDRVPAKADLSFSSAPVLVVGAGPTGLLLAGELCRRGVPCHLIDARPAPMNWDRATVIHPRSLEIFEALGIVDGLMDIGCKQRIIKVFSGGDQLGQIDLSTSGSTYGFNLGLSEEVTESALTAYLQQRGGSVTRGSRLVGLHIQPDGVLAEIEKDGERSTMRARWIVGCDGIHSATRELAGIAFEGHKLPREWAVFDAAIDGWNDTHEGIFAYHDLLPIILTALPRNRWRVYLRPSSGTSDLVAEATSTLHRYVPTASFVAIENPTRFHCFTKIAAHYRSGPVFLAGDSAHLCSPSEGHGMNTGIQDAFNLAWKLALVYQGAAGPSLLDSYEAERRPVAEAITTSGDLFEQAQLLTDPAERRQRDDAIRALLSDPVRLHEQVMAETELSIAYSGSPIIDEDGTGEGGLEAGSRLPDGLMVEWPRGSASDLHRLAHRSGHTLLLLAGNRTEEDRFSRLIEELRGQVAGCPIFESAVALSSREDPTGKTGFLQPGVSERLGVAGITLLAMRPDGYVGLRCDRDHLAAVSRYRKMIQNGGNLQT
jgi:2-polyprenyl-6-methoxyphenol hydroxylase-like FAD-dependent oxidoreductase